MTVDQKPVIIIGAGVVGLSLAHGLKKVSAGINSPYSKLCVPCLA